MAPKAKRVKTHESPLDRCKAALAIVDVDSSGDVSREEFYKAMASIGVDEATAVKLFRRFDRDSSGMLDKDEFFAYAAKGGGELKEVLLRGIVGDSAAAQVTKMVDKFSKFDTNQDGLISKEELQRIIFVLHPSFTQKDLDSVWAAVDANHDGHIDYEEFATWLHSPQPSTRS